jgi:hypothetical protein
MDTALCQFQSRFWVPRVAKLGLGGVVVDWNAKTLYRARSWQPVDAGTKKVNNFSYLMRTRGEVFFGRSFKQGITQIEEDPNCSYWVFLKL